MARLAVCLSAVALLVVAVQVQAESLDAAFIKVTASSAYSNNVASNVLNPNTANNSWLAAGYFSSYDFYFVNGEHGYIGPHWVATDPDALIKHPELGLVAQPDGSYRNDEKGLTLAKLGDVVRYDTPQMRGDNNPTLTFWFYDESNQKAAYDIGSITVTNHIGAGNDEPKRGVYTMDILVSYDGVNFVSFCDDYQFQPSWKLNENYVTEWSVQPEDIFIGKEIMGVQFVITQNQYNANAGSSVKQGLFGFDGTEYGEQNTPSTTLVGLSYVQFNIVPEPATMALLALGGLAMLRRRT